MSNNNGSSNHAHTGDLAREGQRIQELVEKIGTLNDPAARRMLQECLEAVLSFYGHGLTRILELVEQAGPDGEKAYDSLLHDPGVRGLLLIHGLHPIPIETRLTQALDKVRPYMESHGGNVELISLENDFAMLRLQGHCKTCPSSAVTLELAVRAAIEEACPDLAGFEVEGIKTVDDDAAFQHLPKAAPEWMQITADPAEGGFINVPSGEADPLLICKVGGLLYAYHDRCPGCNLPLHLGEIKEGLIICSLGHRYDVKRAGMSPDSESLHLDPLPLMTKDGVVKVARPHANSQPLAEPANP